MLDYPQPLMTFIPDYPLPDKRMPFRDYITLCRAIIKQRRTDLHGGNAGRIIDANSPFEFMPIHPIRSSERIKYGVLLLHGLLDCPFTSRDLADHLQANGILCRSILLPGHGTRPSDLLGIRYQDWLSALRYGIESLSKEVDHIYLAGYSTGASLCAHEAMQGSPIEGLILLAPAIRIKVPINIIVGWHYLKKWLHINHNEWIYRQKEIDYTKYLSIPFNAVNQVSLLSDTLRLEHATHSITCPMFMVLTREDETVSSAKAIEYFSRFQHPESKLLLYASNDKPQSDKRIMTRISAMPELKIRNFSHVSLPYQPDNMHYGKQGDYPYAAHPDKHIYGAYNHAETSFSEKLYEWKIIDNDYRTLTYNPDFAFMADEITKFILR